MTPTLTFNTCEKTKNYSDYGTELNLANISELKNRILKINRKRTQLKLCYFDSDYVWQKVVTETDKPIPNNLTWLSRKDETNTEGMPIISGDYNPLIPYTIGNTNFNRQLLYQAISKLRPGDTLDTLIKYYNTRTEHTYQDWMIMHKFSTPDMSDTNNCLKAAKVSDDVFRFVLKIDKPKIEREVDNHDTSTFDFIRITVGIPTTWPTDRRQFARAHMREINRAALIKLKYNRVWQMYNLPISALKISDCIITQQSEIELLYERR